MPVPDFAQGVTDSNYWFAHMKSMSAPTKTAAAKTNATQTDTKTAANTDSGESFFDDLLDVVNPLQHFPVVSTIYRAVTGDKIGDIEKIAGDALYGGPIGLVSSLADVAFEKITGKDFGDTIMAAIGFGSNDNTTALASNTSKPGAGDTTSAATAKSGSQPLIVANAAPRPLVTLPQTAIGESKPAAALSTPASSAAAQDVAAKSATPVDISPDTDALLQALARSGVTGQFQAQALDAYRRTMQMNSGAPAPAVN